MTVTLKYWSRGAVERIYVSTEDACELGYFERRTETQLRPASSYYDRHRHCKGDHFLTPALPVSWSGEAGIDSMILAACGSLPSPDEHAIWETLCKHSRGFEYAAIGKYSKNARTRQAAKEIDAGNKARRSVTLQLEDAR